MMHTSKQQYRCRQNRRIKMNTNNLLNGLDTMTRSEKERLHAVLCEEGYQKQAWVVLMSFDK
jgi:hypothetical protein